jgi:predicted MFS family arabinose efflux permease
MLLPALCLAGLAANVSGRTLEPLVTIISLEFSVGIATGALLISAYALPFALGQPVLGPLGDIYGKLRMLKISLWALTACLFLAAFAPTFELLMASRFLAGIAAGGVVPACMATIGDSYPPERRQIAISVFVTMGMLAQIFAISASGLVGEAFGWRYVLLATAAFGLLGALAASFVLKSRQPQGQQSFSVGLVTANYKSVFKNPKALLCYSTVFIEGVALYGLMPYVSDMFVQRGIGGASEAGLVIGSIGIGGLAYVLMLKLLLKRFHVYQFMAAGGILMSLGPLSLAADIPWTAVAAAFCVTGFGFMLLHNSIQTQVVDLAPASRQSAYSLHAFSFFMGQAAGPVAFGFGLASVGARSSLIICAFILAATGLVASKLFTRAAKLSAQL